jgi:UDP:flavonoid glycosyltransferase YjiC (YdhE family)
MRVLCSTTAGAGHFGPLVPFARACQAAGDDVRVAAPASFAAEVTGAGFEHLAFADVPADAMAAVFARLPALDFDEANRVVVAEVFGRLDAQAALAGVTAAIERFRPDVVLREPCELASLVAAARADVPHAEVAIGVDAMFTSVLADLEAPLAELGALAGLDARRAIDLVGAAPQLTFVPATLDAAGDALLPHPAATRRQWRFRERAAEVEPRLPAPWGDPHDPLVYVTFGSVTAHLAHLAPVYAATLDAVRGAPFRVLLTTGSVIDPAGLGPLPGNVHVEPWWPQADIMPAVGAVVGHGGFGTTMLALAAGVPQIVVPLFAADQRVNARCIAALGAGIHLADGPGSVGDLAPELERVMTDPAYRVAAGSIAAEIAALPDVGLAVPVVHELAAR